MTSLSLLAGRTVVMRRQLLFKCVFYNIEYSNKRSGMKANKTLACEEQFKKQKLTSIKANNRQLQWYTRYKYKMQCYYIYMLNAQQTYQLRQIDNLCHYMHAQKSCCMTPIKHLLWIAETSLHWLWQIMMANSEIQVTLVLSVLTES